MVGASAGPVTAKQGNGSYRLQAVSGGIPSLWVAGN